MDGRLYRLRGDQERFEAGLAQGKQVLLGTTVHEILLHWFAPNGEFLELERIRMAVEPGTFPGTRIYRTGLDYWEQVNHEIAALKARIDFVPADILIRKFESEEACIEDLPGDYFYFLQHREEYSEEDQRVFDEYIRDWRKGNNFVLEFCEQYWMSASGEVLSA
jgi:hypothetical protein